MSALIPGSVIGILGGGQLGRMLALAAAELGLKTHIYAPPGDNPAFDVAHAVTEAAYDDENALTTFAGSVDVVTLEFENVPVATANHIAALAPIAPGPKALEIAQHRIAEKTFFNDLGIKTAEWIDASDRAAAGTAHSWFAQGASAIVKTCRLGYDGKGQSRANSPDELAQALETMAGQDLIIERMVPFECEISIIAARGHGQDFAAFEPPLNHHRDGILRSSTVPCGLAPALLDQARELARKTLEALDYTGVLAIEFFVVRDFADNDPQENAAADHLLVNEFAPRVHNSGHWTQNACTTSQFHQHIRAVAGWPLGDTARHADCTMINLLGDEVTPWANGQTEPGTAAHIYGKTSVKPGRKMGHLNRLQPLSRG